VGVVNILRFRTDTGGTIIHVAAVCGSPQVLEAVLEAVEGYEKSDASGVAANGRLINALDNQRQSVLHAVVAAGGGHGGRDDLTALSVERLLAVGASRSLVNGAGKRAEDVAATLAAAADVDGGSGSALQETLAIFAGHSGDVAGTGGSDGASASSCSSGGPRTSGAKQKPTATVDPSGERTTGSGTGSGGETAMTALQLKLRGAQPSTVASGPFAGSAQARAFRSLNTAFVADLAPAVAAAADVGGACEAVEDMARQYLGLAAEIKGGSGDEPPQTVRSTPSAPSAPSASSAPVAAGAVPAWTSMAPSASGTVNCPACTFLNPAASMACTMCNSPMTL
jgi:hypothetical protein